MTLFRFGYVAMSMHVQNASPSKTMTFRQFSKIADREAAIRKLERIAKMNLHNCLRILRHNVAHEIDFFRLSSRLVPLANHPELQDWKYMRAIMNELSEIELFLDKHPHLRIDFHPDHFVLLNSKDKNIFSVSLETLQMHYELLSRMGINATHRCVLHVGGSYDDKEKALEQFIHNWGLIPVRLQRMIILENDDASFNVKETLYLCEKLGIPLVFDYHHHLANHIEGTVLKEDWMRIVDSWRDSPLPIKMHISSPKSEKDFRAHAEAVDLDLFWSFVDMAKGTTEQIDVMIEAKLKDEALFQLMQDIRQNKRVEWVTATSFRVW